MPASRTAPEFFSPAPLLAVALLATNDHLLKDAFHNAVTGKLSDVAGCFFLPLFVSAFLVFVTPWSLRVRVGLGALATVALFVPVKVSPAAAGSVCRAIEQLSIPLGIGAQHIVSDPTDLLAVPMTFLAVLYAQRMNPCVAASK